MVGVDANGVVQTPNNFFDANANDIWDAISDNVTDYGQDISDINTELGTLTTTVSNNYNELSDAIDNIDLLKPGSFGMSIKSPIGQPEISAGNKGYLVMPYACTIKSWYIVGDTSGSCVIDIWKRAGAIPTVAHSITASAKPSLTNQQLNNSSTLTGWVTNVSQGDVVSFNVDSVSGLRDITISIKIEK
jgi:hypothetical protein